MNVVQEPPDRWRGGAAQVEGSPERGTWHDGVIEDTPLMSGAPAPIIDFAGYSLLSPLMTKGLALMQQQTIITITTKKDISTITKGSSHRTLSITEGVGTTNHLILIYCLTLGELLYIPRANLFYIMSNIIVHIHQDS